MQAFDHVDVYSVKNGAAYTHQRTGNGVPLSERPYHYWPTFFKVDLQATDTVDLYVRLMGLNRYSPMEFIALYHIDPASVFPQQVYVAAKTWLAIGILGSQFVFFLLLFFIERERIHGYFSTMSLGLSLILLFNNFILILMFLFLS